MRPALCGLAWRLCPGVAAGDNSAGLTGGGPSDGRPSAAPVCMRREPAARAYGLRRFHPRASQRVSVSTATYVGVGVGVTVCLHYGVCAYMCVLCTYCAYVCVVVTAPGRPACFTPPLSRAPYVNFNERVMVKVCFLILAHPPFPLYGLWILTPHWICRL